MNRLSLEEYAKNTGLTPEEFIEELLTSTAALATMQLDSEEAKKEDANTVVFTARNNTHVLNIEITRSPLQ